MIKRLPRNGLPELQRAYKAYMAKWKRSGNRWGRYRCPDCKALVEAGKPSERGEQWDSLRTCPHCGLCHMFIATYGRIRVVATPEVNGGRRGVKA